MIAIQKFWAPFSRVKRSGPSEHATRRRRVSRAFAVPLLFIGVVSACAPVHRERVAVQPQLKSVSDTGEVKPATADPVFAPTDYLINPGDVIDIKFIQRPAYSDTFAVRPDGKISLPWLGSVPVAGRTADDVQGFLTAEYAQLPLQAPPPAQRRYLLSVDDVLDVRFPFSQEFNSEVVVRPDGRISLPLVKSVIVERKTPEQVEAELTARYRKLMEDPELVVMVKEHSSNIYEYNGELRPVPTPGLSEVAVKIRETVPLRIYVGGEVPAPGLQPYRGTVTALQAIMTAGGTLQTGDMRSVVILRRGADETALYIVRNLQVDLNGEGTNDIVLSPFDVVVVPRSTIAKVGDALDMYIYRLVRPLANSSVGFFFTKQIGTQSVDQNTRLVE